MNYRLIAKRSTPYRYLAPTVILLTVFLVIPICMVVQFSFLDKAVVSKTPEFVGFKNYITLFQDKKFWSAASNTAIFVGVSVVAHIVLGMIFAMLLDSKYFKVSKVKGRRKVEIKHDAIQEAQARFGFFALMSNESKDAREAL